PQVRGRRRHDTDGPERVSGAGQGVRGHGRSARPHLQDPGRAGPLPPVQYRPRRRAAALDRGGPLRSRARRRVHPPRPRGGAAPHREGHRRGPGPLYEGSEGRRERRGGHRQAGRPSVHRGVQEEVRVLVVGGGGREHALAWALKRDTPEATLFAAPGNPGTAQLGTNLEIPATATDAPLVVKASGLAAGKGAVVCDTRDAAARAARAMLADGTFGEAGREVVIEDYVEGEELSVLALTDGDRTLMLPAAQDHKRLGEGDTGPNTGRLGAYCPVSIAGDALLERVRREVLEPTLRELAARGARYSGVLYAGLMLAADGTPYVLEFNCRFGDPETQALLPLLPGVTRHL